MQLQIPEIMNIRVPLTEEEVADKGTIIAKLLLEVQAAEEAKKRNSKEYGEQIETLEEEINTLGQDIRVGKWVDEECTVTYDFEAARVIVTRPITGAIVSERDMTQEDRQLKLTEESIPVYADDIISLIREMTPSDVLVPVRKEDKHTAKAACDHMLVSKDGDGYKLTLWGEVVQRSLPKEQSNG